MNRHPDVTDATVARRPGGRPDPGGTLGVAGRPAAGPPPDVVRCITRLNIGGPARQALLLSRELHGEFPTVLVAGHGAAHEGELADPAVAVQRVPLVRPLNPRRDLAALAALRGLLAARRPRILHTHMAKAGSLGRSAALSLGRQRPRLVHTFHGHVLEGYFNPALQRGFIRVERELARRTDVLVAVSPQIRDALLDLGVGRPQQYRVVPLGLDLRAFLAVDRPAGGLRAHLGLRPDVPLVGAVGRLAAVKDLGLLLAAVARLAGVHVALVGDGECRAALAREADRLGLTGRAHLVGWWPDVPGAMSDLDVVVLTSRNEGTPVALIEALAARRPVVATDVGGVGYVVEHEVTGLLAPRGDAGAVAAQLRRSLDDPVAAAARAAVGRQRVRERFGSERLVDDLRALYRELAG